MLCIRICTAQQSMQNPTRVHKLIFIFFSFSQQKSKRKHRSLATTTTTTTIELHCVALSFHFRLSRPHNGCNMSSTASPPPAPPPASSDNTIDAQVSRLLAGSALPVDEDTAALCDFTLAQQNAAVEAQGVQSSAPADYVPVLGKSVTYIVATVLINARDEVLMMQEAKESCAGKWYLPAGRMEAGETIVAAAEREVLEETGLRVAVTTLLAVECAGGSWYRFVCTGRVQSGELKTPQRADAESLQAKWIANLGELNLRSNDIVPLVELGR